MAANDDYPESACAQGAAGRTCPPLFAAGPFWLVAPGGTRAPRRRYGEVCVRRIPFESFGQFGPSHFVFVGLQLLERRRVMDNPSLYACIFLSALAAAYEYHKLALDVQHVHLLRRQLQ